jgi:peptide methionine sulfoxide reductase MsrA
MRVQQPLLLLQLLCALCQLSTSAAWKGLSNVVGQLANHKQTLKRLCVAPLIAAQLCMPPASGASEGGAGGANVYFGVGCFWHVQHEFVQAEKTVLGRTDDQITSLAGYAGSTKLGKDTNRPGSAGVVCYHNLLGVGDYGSLGYGEVVQVNVPEDKGLTSYRAFADQYFSLMGKDGDRPDKGDRGPEYRR